MAQPESNAFQLTDGSNSCPSVEQKMAKETQKLLAAADLLAYAIKSNNKEDLQHINDILTKNPEDTLYLTSEMERRGLLPQLALGQLQSPETFNKLDKDHNGRLSKDEVRSLPEGMKPLEAASAYELMRHMHEDDKFSIKDLKDKVIPEWKKADETENLMRQYPNLQGMYFARGAINGADIDRALERGPLTGLPPEDERALRFMKSQLKSPGDTFDEFRLNELARKYHTNATVAGQLAGELFRGMARSMQRMVSQAAEEYANNPDCKQTLSP